MMNPKSTLEARTEEGRAARVPAILVVGMHRSGTSVVARLLESRGATLQSRQASANAGATEPPGSGQVDSTTDFCTALLREANAEWWKVSELDGRGLPPGFLDEQTNVLREQLQAHDGAAPLVLEDPQWTLLLPLLQDALAGCVVVHVVRNPLEVARALRERDGLPVHLGVALWTAYNLAALQHVEAGRRVFVSFERLLADPTLSSQQLLDKLSALGVVGLNADAATERADAGHLAIVPSLRRHHATDRELESILTASQLALWNALSQSLDGEQDPLRGLEPRLSDLEGATLRELEAEEETRRLDQRRLLDHEKELAQLRTTLEQSEVARMDALTRLAESEARLANLPPDRSAWDRERGALESALSDKEARVAHLEQLLAARDSDAMRMTSKLSDRAAHAQGLLTALRERERAITALTQKLEGQDVRREAMRTRMARLAQKLEKREKSIATLRQSFSWRVTAPLRVLPRLAKRGRRHGQ